MEMTRLSGDTFLAFRKVSSITKTEKRSRSNPRKEAIFKSTGIMRDQGKKVPPD